MAAQQFLGNVSKFSQAVGSIRIGGKFETCSGRKYELVSRDDFTVRARDIETNETDYFIRSAKCRPVK